MEAWTEARQAPREDTVCDGLPLAALEALLGALGGAGGSSCSSRRLHQIAEQLNPEEICALRELEAVGQRCRTLLRPATRAALGTWRPDSGGGAFQPPPRVRRAEALDDEDASPAVGPRSSCASELSRGSALGEDRIQRVFEEFDRDGDGLIILNDFEDLLRRMGVAEEQVLELAVLADTNADGFVDYEEFTAFVGDSVGEGVDDGEQEDEVDEDDPRRLTRALEGAGNAARVAEAQLARAQEELAQAEAKCAARLRRLEERHERSEAEHEFQAKMASDFWRGVADCSAGPKLNAMVDLSAAELLSQGKYGVVLKALLIEDGERAGFCTVKLFRTRWADRAVKEWANARYVADLAGVVAVAEKAVLHADEDKIISRLVAELASKGGQSAQAPPRGDRVDRYLCLFQELTNLGPLSAWMAARRARPCTAWADGLLAATRQVADTLAQMHHRGVSHNRVRPDSVLLHLDSSGVCVKLCEFGFMSREAEHAKDVSELALSVHSMVTGEEFDVQQLKPDALEGVIERFRRRVFEAAGEASQENGQACAQGALRALPALLDQAWTAAASAADVRDAPCLQGRSFDAEAELEGLLGSG